MSELMICSKRLDTMAVNETGQLLDGCCLLPCLKRGVIFAVF